MTTGISDLERELAMEMCNVLHIEWSRATYQWAVKFLRENADRLALLKTGECAAQPFLRVFRAIDPVTTDLPDDTPLREVIPGAWPTLGDLRRLAAQGIEAGTATTVKQGVVHESPVAESDAPKGGLS